LCDLCAADKLFSDYIENPSTKEDYNFLVNRLAEEGMKNLGENELDAYRNAKRITKDTMTLYLKVRSDSLNRGESTEKADNAGIKAIQIVTDFLGMISSRKSTVSTTKETQQ